MDHRPVRRVDTHECTAGYSSVAPMPTTALKPRARLITYAGMPFQSSVAVISVPKLQIKMQSPKVFVKIEVARNCSPAGLFGSLSDSDFQSSSEFRLACLPQDGEVEEGEGDAGEGHVLPHVHHPRLPARYDREPRPPTPIRRPLSRRRGDLLRRRL